MDMADQEHSMLHFTTIIWHSSQMSLRLGTQDTGLLWLCRVLEGLPG